MALTEGNDDLPTCPDFVPDDLIEDDRIRQVAEHAEAWEDLDAARWNASAASIETWPKSFHTLYGPDGERRVVKTEQIEKLGLTCLRVVVNEHVVMPNFERRVNILDYLSAFNARRLEVVRSSLAIVVFEGESQLAEEDDAGPFLGWPGDYNEFPPGENYIPPIVPNQTYAERIKTAAKLIDETEQVKVLAALLGSLTQNSFDVDASRRI